MHNFSSRYFPTFWRFSAYNKLIEDSFNKLKLPNYNSTWPPKSESELEKDILNYVNLIFDDSCCAFYKAMSVILRNINPATNFDDVASVLWSDVIETICNENLKQTQFSLRYTEFYTKSSFRDMFVVYDIDSLKRYCEASWFYVQNPAVAANIQQQYENMVCEEPDASECEEDVQISDFDVDRIYSEFVERSSSFSDEDEVSKNRADVTELKNLMADLEETMEIQKKINATLQVQFKKAMKR